MHVPCGEDREVDCNTLQRTPIGKISTVVVTHAFAGLAVRDFAAAYRWYVRLFGRPADVFPHDAEAVWHLTPNSSIYVVHDPDRAGSGLVTLAVVDLDIHEQRLREAGLPFTEQRDGPVPRRLVCEDDDGNTLTLFQDPTTSQP